MKNISIIVVVLLYSSSINIIASPIFPLKNIEIIETDENSTSSFFRFKVLNDNLFSLVDHSSKKLYLIDSNGIIQRTLVPKIKYVDSIAVYCESIMKYGKIRNTCEFLSLDELVVVSDSSIFDKSLIDVENIKIPRYYSNIEMINYSIIALIGNYRLIAEERATGRRGGETRILLHYYDILNDSIIYTNYLEHRVLDSNNIIVSSGHLLTSNSENDIVLEVNNLNRNISNNKYELLASLKNYTNDFNILNYYPDSLLKYRNISVLNMMYLAFANEETILATQYDDKIYNLSSNTFFKIKNLTASNERYLLHTQREVERPSSNFQVKSISILPNDNLLLTLMKKIDGFNRLFGQEYTLDGELVKEMKIDSNSDSNNIFFVSALKYSNIFYCFSYDNDNETYHILPYEWDYEK